MLSSPPKNTYSFFFFFLQFSERGGELCSGSVIYCHSTTAVTFSRTGRLFVWRWGRKSWLCKNRPEVILFTSFSHQTTETFHHRHFAANIKESKALMLSSFHSKGLISKSKVKISILQVIMKGQMDELNRLFLSKQWQIHNSTAEGTKRTENR